MPRLATRSSSANRSTAGAIDYHGEYKNGAWEFDLTDPKYAAGFGFKFFLRKPGG